MSTGPKSAYELAMERLRRKDEEAGVTEVPISDVQKAAIAEARNLCEARVAERRILLQSALATAFDPGIRETLEVEFRRDIERFTTDRDRKIEKIRRGES
jgi:hypothetical protein